MPAEQGQPLSERELEITALVAEGVTNREIAERLFLSPNTIKVHLRNIFTKNGVSTRTELSMMAVQEGWIVLTNIENEFGVSLGEVQAGETDIVTPQFIASWSWRRWITLSFSFVFIIIVMVLPGLPVRQVASTGPGQIFGPAPEIPGQGQSDADGRWKEGAPLPVRRAGMGVASLDGKAYIIGGINAEGTTARTDIYDIITNAWETGQPRPVALGNLEAVALSGNVFVPGGCDSDWIPQNAVHIYKPQTDTWTLAVPLPQPLCAYALAEFQEKVYLFGGWNGDTYTALGFVYDPVEDDWRSIAPPTVVRGFGGAAVIGDRIFYIGGFDGRRELDNCEVYSPEDDEWEVCPPMLQPRGGIGVAATTGRIYVLGGGWSSFLGFNEQFSPENGQWTVMDTPMVGEWRNVGAFVWERSLYVIGGWGGSDFLNLTYAVEIMPFRVFMPGTFRTP
ncbi:MAG: helix-turn-helix domain-containing protein [Anaerolineales bacterium]|nr:MAG: helix-turn-helix domain-containing protein [Anaerolineales bacterium]